MRIGIYGINYSPELTGIGKYTGEMAAWLSARGHQVEMFTGMPYYPEWNIHAAYKGKFYFTELNQGIKVFRSPIYVPKKASSFKRIINESSFVVGLIPRLIASLFKKKYDVVICIVPPIQIAILPLLYCRIRKVKFICHIQDLQIDAAKNLEMIKSHFLLKVLFKIEKFILDRSQLVTSISPGMLKQIEKKGIHPNKLELFPNWVDTAFIKPLKKEYSLRDNMGISRNERVILYSGNIGEKQGLEMLIDVAKHFADDQTVKFVIVGSGSGKEKLQQLVNNEKLENVSFFPLINYENLSRLLSIADLHLVLQKKSASDLVLPSKLSGILSAGGCAIVTAERGSSLYEIIADNEIGYIAEPENIDSLIETLEKALSMDNIKLKERARRYAVSNLSKDQIMFKFEQSLMSAKIIHQESRPELGKTSPGIKLTNQS